MAPSDVRALVLRTIEFAEHSQIAHLFTDREGRVHGIAKGARRQNSAFHGGMDLLQFGALRLYPRRAGAGLRTLASFRVATHFPGLRRAIPRFRAAEHVRALLLGFLREEYPAPEVFELTLSALRLIEVAEDSVCGGVAAGFEAMLLGYTGFAPELTRCVRCEREARNIVTARLSVLRGGLLCSRCRGEDPGAPELSGRAVASLVTLGNGPLAHAVRLPPDRRLRREIRSALERWTSAILDRRLMTHDAVS